MQTYLIWLIAGFALVIAELVTGTFYLLVLGIAAFAGSATAWCGLGFWFEALAAVVVAIAGVLWLRQQRRAIAAQPDMPPLDLGQAVVLDAWVNREQGAARVKYRDALWDAEVEGEHDCDRGQTLYIRAVHGSTLTVSRHRP